jgi:hypothetical protein
MFNGINVVQTRDFIKIDCHTYVGKFCAKYLKSWLSKVPLSENCPTPLPTNATWIKKFNAAVGSSDPDEQHKLATKMQIKYIAGVGELIWAMTTCRPDIAFTSVKLSQSNSAPAEHHYHGLKHAIRYVYITWNDGIYFWRTASCTELPERPLPTVNSNRQDLLVDDHPDHDATTAVDYGNSDWATCMKTRQSFSGICIQLAGGTIAYKTKFQSTVTLSSTEANSWQLVMLVACVFLFGAFCGTSTFHRKLLPLHTKIMMDVPLWQMHRNQCRVLDTSILNTPDGPGSGTPTGVDPPPSPS